ncbi:hypothetical protein OH77DRAFT_1516772 [Trametes cingulata]|nr:hypothetical protein OH77DRAFT_1516772 [Trametes cingulata]
MIEAVTNKTCIQTNTAEVCKGIAYARRIVRSIFGSDGTSRLVQMGHFPDTPSATRIARPVTRAPAQRAPSASSSKRLLSSDEEEGGGGDGYWTNDDTEAGEFYRPSRRRRLQ